MNYDEVDLNEVMKMAFLSTGNYYFENEEMGLNDVDSHYLYWSCNSYPSAIKKLISLCITKILLPSDNRSMVHNIGLRHGFMKKI